MPNNPLIFWPLAAISMLIMAVGPDQLGSIDVDNVFLFVAGMFAGLAIPRSARTQQS